jgi:hypothetical protein
LFRNVDPDNDEIMRVNKPLSYGPWLVGLGAALWGTESAWRIPLNSLFDARVIVFWEHVLIFIGFLPLLLTQTRELPMDAHLGIPYLFRIRWFSRRHNFFHPRSEGRQSHSGKCDFEYPAGHFHLGRFLGLP